MKKILTKDIVFFIDATINEEEYTIEFEQPTADFPMDFSFDLPQVQEVDHTQFENNSEKDLSQYLVEIEPIAPPPAPKLDGILIIENDLPDNHQKEENHKKEQEGIRIQSVEIQIDTTSSADAASDQKNTFAEQVDFRHLLKKRNPVPQEKPASTSAESEPKDFRALLKKRNE